MNKRIKRSERRKRRERKLDRFERSIKYIERERAIGKEMRGRKRRKMKNCRRKRKIS